MRNLLIAVFVRDDRATTAGMTARGSVSPDAEVDATGDHLGSTDSA